MLFRADLSGLGRCRRFDGDERDGNFFGFVWVRRLQPKISTDGGSQNDGEYSKADHDHDLLLRSASMHRQKHNYRLSIRYAI